MQKFVPPSRSLARSRRTARKCPLPCGVKEFSPEHHSRTLRVPSAILKIKEVSPSRSWDRARRELPMAALTQGCTFGVLRLRAYHFREAPACRGAPLRVRDFLRFFCNFQHVSSFVFSIAFYRKTKKSQTLRMTQGRGMEEQQQNFTRSNLSSGSRIAAWSGRRVRGCKLHRPQQQ